MPLPKGLRWPLSQEGDRYVLNNHLRFKILYHRDQETDLSRIVGFEAGTFSLPYLKGCLA